MRLHANVVGLLFCELRKLTTQGRQVQVCHLLSPWAAGKHRSCKPSFLPLCHFVKVSDFSLFRKHPYVECMQGARGSFAAAPNSLVESSNSIYTAHARRARILCRGAEFTGRGSFRTKCVRERIHTRLISYNPDAHTNKTHTSWSRTTRTKQESCEA